MTGLASGRCRSSPPGMSRSRPRKVGSEVGGYTFATYANDGAAYVATGGRLWHLRDHVLRLLRVPEGAPTPAGPFAWVAQEPTTDL